VKILVYGAGVIGTLYAARLQEGGHRVTVVARGQRLADIRRYGLALEDVVSNGRSTTQVETTERLGPQRSIRYRTDCGETGPSGERRAGARRKSSHPILIFMLNNPTGSSDLAQALGRDRVLLGFPGAGGTRDRHLVRYAMIAQQPTTLGELDGRPNSAPAQTGRNIPAVRISYGDVSRHGRVAKGARLLRDFRQWRDLHGRWRLSPTLRR
jgi:2-dehydropantoate 2-reductase